ncbi:O-antigen polymerase [Alloalcanivorax sp. C16-2]|uniref:O-antigen polymerase n=1 Tax=Alloalcanivorax sp. C16-2 TaxID=3390052 RepID=UPI003970EC4A
MEYFLVICSYLCLFLFFSVFIWKQSPAESKYVVTGVRLLVAFLVFRCSIAYFSYDTDIISRVKALTALGVAFIGLSVAQYGIAKIYISPGIYLQEGKDDIGGRKFLFLVALMFVVAVVLFQGIPAGFYFWNILGSSEMSALRREISKSYLFGGSEYRGQGVFRTVIEVMGAFLFSFSVLAFFKSKQKLKKALYALSSVIVSLILISEGSRGMLMNAIVAAVCSYVYVNPKVKIRKIFLSCFAVLAIFFASSLITSKSMALRDGAISFSDFSSTLFERLFMANAINDIYIFEIEPNENIKPGPMYWLARDIKASIPGMSAGKPLAYELYYYKTGDLKGTTYLTGTHMMKAYMDGGYVSVFFQYFAIGLVVCFIDKLVYRKIILPKSKNKTFYYAVAGSLALFSGLSFITGLIGTLINLAVLFLVVWLGVGTGKLFHTLFKSRRNETSLSF